MLLIPVIQNIDTLSAERQAFMVQDSGAVWLLTHSSESVEYPTRRTACATRGCTRATRSRRT